MRWALTQLTPREREILKYRWGISIKAKGKTLEDAGQKFGVVRERVRQLEAKAFIKLEELKVAKK